MSNIKALIELIGQQLVNSFDNWLEVNKDKLNPKFYNKLKKELRKVNISTVPGVVGVALWMLQILGEAGCYVGVGPYGYTLQRCENLDRISTEKVLLMISTALKLQYIPPEEGIKY
jgi:hypothetical protein